MIKYPSLPSMDLPTNLLMPPLQSSPSRRPDYRNERSVSTVPVALNPPLIQHKQGSAASCPSSAPCGTALVPRTHTGQYGRRWLSCRLGCSLTLWMGKWRGGGGRAVSWGRSWILWRIWYVDACLCAGLLTRGCFVVCGHITIDQGRASEAI